MKMNIWDSNGSIFWLVLTLGSFSCIVYGETSAATKIQGDCPNTYTWHLQYNFFPLNFDSAILKKIAAMWFKAPLVYTYFFRQLLRVPKSL